MRIPLQWLKEYVDVPGELKTFTDKMSMIGHLLDKLDETENDTVVDLELRGNRADCYAVLGIAREAAASFKSELRIPNINFSLPKNQYSNFSVEVESPAVTRFYSTIIKGIKIQPSPDWIQKRLRDYGLDPINNIVDITNYVMIETGMPLHAFDLNRMNGNKLILRKAKKSEKVQTFDGGELELTDEDTVFASEKGNLLGIAGIIGGKGSGIHEDTTDILLECAGYDRVAIRKSMYRHNAMTDAGLRHSHALSASLCDYTLSRAASLIIEFGGGDDVSKVQGIHDYYPEPEKEVIIEYDPQEALRLGGIEVSVQEQIDILKRLEFNVEDSEQKGMLKVTAPLFRTDILASEDIVEEVLRIYGYEKIPAKTLSSVIPDPIVQKELVIEERSKDLLTALGLNEVITVPMTTLEALKKSHDPYSERAIKLINPASSEHTYLRTNMYTGLLDATRRVLDRGDEEVTFFEVGKIYLKKDKELHQPPHKPEFPYSEHRRIAGVISSKKNSWDFYKVKGILEEYFNQLHLKNIQFVKNEHSSFELSADIIQHGKAVGVVGIFKKEVSEQNFDIKQTIFGFVLNVDEIVKASFTPITFMPFSQYPSVKQDMSVLVDQTIQAGDLQNLILEEGKDLIRNISIEDVYILENKKKSLLFSITYQSKERTLSSEEVNDLHMRIENKLTETFGVVIRGREEVESLMQNRQPSVNDGMNVETRLDVLNKKEEITQDHQKQLQEIPGIIKEGEKQEIIGQHTIVVGQIVDIIKHSDADRLVICKINVGKAKPTGTLYEDYLQIVTGAKNITEGRPIGAYIPVALPGAKVFSYKDGTQFSIGISKLRGEVSEGMLCSKAELGLKDEEGGIWIIDGDMYQSKIGEPFFR